MAATVVTEVWTGGTSGSPGSKTNASTLRFRTDDSPTTTDTSNPLIIPDSGTNYSYWVHLALDISGTFSEVSNIRFYSDGTLGWSLGTAGQVARGNRDSGDQGCPEASYDPASGTVGTSGNDLGANHSYFSAQTTSEADAFAATSGSPITVDSSTYTTATSSKAVVLQADVDTDASTGTQADETFTFLYDEV